jgi:hypothetical protein
MALEGKSPGAEAIGPDQERHSGRPKEERVTAIAEASTGSPAQWKNATATMPTDGLFEADAVFMTASSTFKAR